MVVCVEGVMDDAEKVVSFHPCDGDGSKFDTDENYSKKNCTGGRHCYFHVCAPVKLCGPAPTKDQKSIFLVFYHDWNMGDSFGSCDENKKDEFPSAIGGYTTKEAALEALQLPLDSALPDCGNDVHSKVEPPLAHTTPMVATGTDADLGEYFVNGELYCREYPVSGW